MSPTIAEVATIHSQALALLRAGKQTEAQSHCRKAIDAFAASELQAGPRAVYLVYSWVRFLKLLGHTRKLNTAQAALWRSFNHHRRKSSTLQRRSSARCSSLRAACQDDPAASRYRRAHYRRLD